MDTRPRFVAHGRLRQAWTTVGVWAVLGLGAHVVTAAAGTRWKHQAFRLWCRLASCFVRIDWDLDGRESIDPKRTYIVVPLHEGFADVLALARLGLDVRFVALAELAEWPALGAFFERSGAVLVDPAAPRTAYRAMLKSAAAASGAGESLVVFPQGTILGLETEFREGAFAVARRLEIPILPVVITGTHRVWEHPFSARLRFRQRVSVRVLPPIESADVDRAELQARMKRIAQAPGLAPARRFDPGRDGWWSDYPYAIDPAFEYLAAREARERHASQGSAHHDVRADIG